MSRERKRKESTEWLSTSDGTWQREMFCVLADDVEQHMLAFRLGRTSVAVCLSVCLEQAPQGKGRASP